MASCLINIVVGIKVMLVDLQIKCPLEYCNIDETIITLCEGAGATRLITHHVA